MPLIDLHSATSGYGIGSRLRIKAGHLRSLIRRITPARLLNVLKAEGNRVLGRTRINSMPFFLKIESCGICNLGCRWCTGSRKERAEGERQPARMTLESFQNIIDQTGKYLFRVNLYGFGEPLLFPETLDMIRCCSRRNISVVVSSNMNIRQDNLAECILDSGLEQLIFSCHGTSGKTVRQFMGPEADPELAFENVRQIVLEKRRWRSRYPIVSWQFCITGFNQHEMKEARKIAARLGVNEIRFIRPWFPPEAGREWHSSLFPERSVMKGENRGQGCSWPWRGAYISCDSGVLPCCREELFVRNDYGNLSKTSFREIWNGTSFVESRKLIRDPGGYLSGTPVICRNCPELGFLPTVPEWEKE